MRAILARLARGERWMAAELVLRGLGLALLGLCAWVALWLHRSVAHAQPGHAPTPLHLGAAAIVAASFGLGACLTCEGPMLFRHIPAPGRSGSFTR